MSDRLTDRAQKGRRELKRCELLRNHFLNMLKLLYLLLILALLLSVATYTWFSISHTPQIHNMALYVNTYTGLQMANAMDAPEDEWGNDWIYSEHHQEPAVLRPITYSDREDCFYTARVGKDGRVVDIAQLLDDDHHANRSDVNGYYLKFDIFVRTDEAVSVSLANTEQGTYVVEMPKWNLSRLCHEKTDNGLERAMRVGFRITCYDEQGNTIGEKPRMIVYEPNACEDDDYRATACVDQAEYLVPPERLIRQQMTLWQEADPIQKDHVIYHCGEFIDNPALFDLMAGQVAQIEIYLWLEGQDADCVYDCLSSTNILTHLQFHSVPQKQSGMEEITEDR